MCGTRCLAPQKMNGVNLNHDAPYLTNPIKDGKIRYYEALLDRHGRETERLDYR